MYKKGQNRPKKSPKKKAKLMAAMGNPILSNKPMTIKSHKPDSNYV